MAAPFPKKSKKIGFAYALKMPEKRKNKAKFERNIAKRWIKKTGLNLR
jgi:hypothetical protein